LASAQATLPAAGEIDRPVAGLRTSRLDHERHDVVGMEFFGASEAGSLAAKPVLDCASVRVIFSGHGRFPIADKENKLRTGLHGQVR
jgi:hypothetical protein